VYSPDIEAHVNVTTTSSARRPRPAVIRIALYKNVAGLAAGSGSGPSTSTPRRWKSGMTQIQKPAFGVRVLGRVARALIGPLPCQPRGNAAVQQYLRNRRSAPAPGPVTRSVRSDTLVACLGCWRRGTSVVLTHTKRTTTWVLVLANAFPVGCDAPCCWRLVVRGGLGAPRCSAHGRPDRGAGGRSTPPGGALRVTSFAGCYRRPRRHA